MMDRIVMEVSRYRPEIESAPTFQAYEVPLTREWAVLDGLTYIKDHLDGTLSFRWSCRMGICGSSGMTINGDPKLACATFLADYLPGPVRVEPMRNFPVIRDLVVDISDFMAKLPSVKPWLVRHDEPPVEDGEYRQTPAELDAFKRTGGVVTAAGLVFAATMSSFVFSDLRVLGQIGTTIGLGLLFDTLVVRAFMTPSIAVLLGRWFWWPQRVRPRPASRMLRPYGPRPVVRELLLREGNDDPRTQVATHR